MPGTRVVMADGSSKNIEDLNVGEQVLATDPETGDTRAREVTDTRNHKSDKHLLTLTVDPDGKNSQAKPCKITSISAHLFWLPDAGKWVKAQQLKPGMWLQTSSGTWIQITAIDDSHRSERVHNLTVAGVHTYYVLAGATPVLVHNCGNAAEAEHAYIAADALQQGRYRATKESISGVRGAQGQYGTTAVIGVRNTTTGDISVRTAVTTAETLLIVGRSGRGTPLCRVKVTPRRPSSAASPPTKRSRSASLPAMSAGVVTRRCHRNRESSSVVGSSPAVQKPRHSGRFGGNSGSSK
ncbi:polymorphic toxin-type HINT domain-containing protein [Streptomyces scopuliridis]|uniref:polymorphic toxin-type HINT domain-containing protein n=1 Tax=Streptomyces scopuliridis TaxID=452529 RepID=UPI0034342781